MYYSAEFLIERLKQLDDFKSIPKDYWIIGIRSSEDKPDKFDDVFNLMKGETLILQTSGTTNPGVKILKNGFKKYNKDGAALVEADRIYYNVWMYGLHLGRTPALRQRGNKITVWRDGNGNAKSEQIGKRTTGYYGINFHPDQRDINAPDKKGENIGGWSAGCQVCNNIEDYRIFIEKCKEQKNVTYCLLNEFSI
jgi:hypothetical protein